MSLINSELQKRNEYGCTLLIDTSDDDPQIITDLLGLEASEIIVKGSDWLSPMTKRIIEGRYHKYNLWIYKIGKEHLDVGFGLDSALEKMLDILDSKQELVIDIFKKYSQNHIVCYAYFYDVNPYFKLDKCLIRRLNKYQIDVEFDMYCLGDSPN